jgi:hypothetical protein
MADTWYVIEDEIDLTYLKSLKDRLFSENKMTADDMRDAGNRLQILIDRLVEISPGDLS